MAKGDTTRFVKQLNSRDGKASNTKIWMNVACLVSTATVIWYAYNLKLSDWMFILYLATTGGFDVISKIIALRFGGPVQSTAPEAEPKKEEKVEIGKCENCPAPKPATPDLNADEEG